MTKPSNRRLKVFQGQMGFYDTVEAAPGHEANDATPVTKLELAQYYAAVGEWMPPRLRGRPCSMIRMPDGIEGAQKFFQRHSSRGQSALITEVEVWGDRKP